jgi:hypothetical protein
MRIICKNLAMGGNLITLCENLDVCFGETMAWINEDQERTRRLNAALKAQGLWEADAILRELKRIALVDIRELYDSNGTVRPAEDWPAHLAAAIQSVEVEELFEGSGKDRTWTGYTKKVKFWDKSKSIEMLLKKLKLYTDRHEVSIVRLEDLVTGEGEVE